MYSLRALPSVDQVLRNLKHLALPPELLADEVRTVLAHYRNCLLATQTTPDKRIEDTVEERLRSLLQPSLRPVINASGVILHTNLGRAPLASFRAIPRYSNLEYDLQTGERGKRDVHTGSLLQRLLQRPAIVVNNNAAAVYLVLHELAVAREVIVSRGELIEIGDGFRIPEIMMRSGAILREVGTTNRTRIDDYRSAINDKTAMILRVHPSNFRMDGFTGTPSLDELAQLGRDYNLPVYEDIGSGCLLDLKSQGIDEPLVTDSLRLGINLVSFSCDKLLGGPQSGIIAGDEILIQRIRRNPMYRAFRVDKLIVESLQTTLHHFLTRDWQAVPTLKMIFAGLQEIHERAERVMQKLSTLSVKMRQSESAIGGGSTPGQVLPTWVVELSIPSATKVERVLRTQPVPVIARIEQNKILLDMRTVADEEEESLVLAVIQATRA